MEGWIGLMRGIGEKDGWKGWMDERDHCFGGCQVGLIRIQFRQREREKD